MDEKPGPAKTSLGIDENIAGALSYLLLWVTGIVFLVVEKENRFVRFHAMQSVAVFLPLTVASFIVGMLPVIGWLLGNLIWLATVILWLILMIFAAQGKQYKLPVVGDFAENQLNKS